MTREEEIFLIKKIRNENSNEARTELYKAYQYLIKKIAVTYISRVRDLTLEDLQGEGTLGFFMAIERYDISNGAKFDTYAYNWIRERILAAIKANERKIYVPYTQAQNISKLKKYLEEANKFGYKGKEAEMYAMSNMNMTEEKFDSLIKNYKLVELAQNTLDYDSCLNVAGDSTNVEGVVDKIYNEELNTLLIREIDKLEEFEKVVFKALFFEGKTIKDLVSSGYSIDKIKKAKNSGLKKLKSKLIPLKKQLGF